MKLRISIFLFLTVILLAVEPGQIVINEICFNPDGVDEEWIELHNIMRSDITLDSTVYISDGEGTYYFEGLTVPAGGFITMKSRTEGGFPFDADIDISDAGIQLSNVHDELFIKEGETLIDSIDYYASWCSLPGHTLERKNPYFTGLHPLNLVAGLREEGTPGEVNSVHTSPTEFPPAVVRIEYSPSIPSATEMVDVEAVIIDEMPLADVTLHYTNGDISGESDMTDIGDNWYSGSIEEFSHGDMVSYFIVAVDVEAQVDTSETKAYFVIDSIVEGPIVINEIMYDSPGEDNEWIELYNRTEEEINLYEWTLKDGSRSEFEFPEDAVIAPNGYLVVAGNGYDFYHEYGIENYTGDFPFALNNSGDSIILKNDDGRLIDILEYSTGGGWPSIGHGDGYTLQLNDPETDNSDPVNWSGSTVLGGTPGEANDAVKENITFARPEKLMIKSISPNPFNSSFRLDFDAINSEEIKLEILDTRGAIVLKQKIDNSFGSVLVDANNMESGVYIIKISANNYSDQSKAVLIK
ncbi:MAG: lamin tail domain-containing protein [Candidatus Zixiibacteriota bacterium]